MKQRSKKAVEAYSFDEYKKKFPPPALKKPKRPETPTELGIKLAEASLAKARAQSRRS